MFTSKERSNLRSIAQNLEPIAQVGKNGVGEKMLESLNQALEAREIIKISVLQSAEDTPEFIAEELSKRLNAEVVCTIGKKIVLYRKSSKEWIKHIEF